MKNKIAFIGMMGCGKSTVAKIFAIQNNLAFYDSDELFEKENNILIKDYFKKYGEQEFRKQETLILSEITKRGNFVLSCGGGVILKCENRDILFKSDIFTIYLKTSSQAIFERIKSDNSRPLLLVENPKSEIEKIMQERKEFYELANLTIETDNKTPQEIVKEINGKY